MRIRRGIELLDESEGKGNAAENGDRVVFNLRIHLNRGDEVPLNERQAQHIPADALRIVDGRPLVDHTTTLGKRQSIAAVEYTLIGMRPGGYRKVRASPHLAYRKQGIPGLIPKDAVLVLEIWLRASRPRQHARTPEPPKSRTS